MVYHATHSDRATVEVAIKTVHKRRCGSVCDRDMREIKVWEHLQNVAPGHVVSLLDVKQSKSKIFVIMELMRGGDLSDTMRQGNVRDERDAWRLFSQLTAGVAACHGASVCHRDLKPKNLLMTGRDGTLKVADFGLATRLAGVADALPPASGLSPDYAAPEVLRRLTCDGYEADMLSCGYKADMWSCGVILFELLTGYLPFEPYLQGYLSDAIAARDHRRVRYPPCMADGAKHLLSKLLDANPTNRWSVCEVQGHPWLKGGLAAPSVGGGDDVVSLGNFVATALDGRPACQIAEVVRLLGTHDVYCVQDLEALVRSTRTSDRLKSWLLRKGFQRMTVERLTLYLVGA